jgi:endonuclease YncB( thermonuclease family)
VGSNPAAPTILNNYFNILRRSDFLPARNKWEQKRYQRHGWSQKVPPKSRQMFMICAILGMMCGPLPAQELAPVTGRATVTDGDTLTIGAITIRLQGIDAPESGQLCNEADGKPWRCGQAAALALEAMTGRRTVTCDLDPRDPADRYGRALGMCRAGGVDLNLAMVRDGHAVAYRRFLDYRDGTPRAHKEAFIAAEVEARTARRGLWRGIFTMPEEWRRARRR